MTILYIFNLIDYNSLQNEQKIKSSEFHVFRFLKKCVEKRIWGKFKEDDSDLMNIQNLKFIERKC